MESYVRKKHSDKCIEIVFLRKGCLESYTDKLGRTTRFELRDDILMKNLSDQICHIWTATEEGLEEEDLGSDCQSCYGTKIPKPLNLGSFDVLTVDNECTNYWPDNFGKLYKQGKYEEVRKLYDIFKF